MVRTCRSKVTNCGLNTLLVSTLVYSHCAAGLTEIQLQSLDIQCIYTSTLLVSWSIMLSSHETPTKQRHIYAYTSDELLLSKFSIN